VLSRIEFMFLGLVWGASFALYRVAIPELGLAVTVELRLLLAATTLCLVFGSPLRRIPVGDRRRSLGWIVLIGAGTTALPFSLFAETVMRSSAGFAAVLNASSPLFSALLAACVWRESLSGSKAVGLMLGFAGVALLASLRELGALRIGVDAVLLGLAGAASYGLCVQLTRRKLGTLDSSAVATGFSVVGAVLLLPWALAVAAVRDAFMAGGAGGSGAGPCVDGARQFHVFPPAGSHGRNARAERHLPHSTVRHAVGAYAVRRDADLCDAGQHDHHSGRHRAQSGLAANAFVSLESTHAMIGSLMNRVEAAECAC
jgi:drug/metabolite transporter (DMT)-like permease